MGSGGGAPSERLVRRRLLNYNGTLQNRFRFRVIGHELL
jgi:hypothetical protein